MEEIYQIIEWVAVIAGLLQVYLAYKNRAINFLFAIISSLLFIFLFLGATTQLYAEALLQSYYVVMGIYGWLRWSKDSDKGKSLPIRRIIRRETFITFLIAIGGWILIGTILDYYTSSTVPYWDAIVASVAFAGTWLLAKKILENWWVLNISNAIAVPLYIYKDLYLTAFLTVCLFIMAIFGYMSWRKIYERQKLLHD